MDSLLLSNHKAKMIMFTYCSNRQNICFKTTKKSYCAQTYFSRLPGGGTVSPGRGGGGGTLYARVYCPWGTI